MTVHGLDISHWQSVTPPLGAQDFVFVRATYGSVKDGKYGQHAANVRAAGKVLGAYCFGRSGQVDPVARQVSAFLAVSGGADLLVLDLENDAGNPDMTEAEASHFIAEVKRLRPGVPIGLYASLSGFPQRLGQQFNWVAKWSLSPPSIPWTFWQYTSSGSLPGYTGRLDMNRFNGTLAELHALAKGEPEMPQAPVTNTTPKLIDVAVGADLLDIDGVTKVTDNKVARTNVYSPYGSYTKRLFALDIDGAGDDPRRLVYVVPSAIRDIPAPEPAPRAYTVTVQVGGDEVVGTVTLP